MIALARACSFHWHAVERDLLSLGYTADDIGSKLTVWQLVSIVVAAPPGTAVHHAVGNWTRQEDILATLAEQQAGVAHVNARYERPGVDSRPGQTPSAISHMPDYQGVRLDAEYGPDEFTAKLKERQRLAREGMNKS
jgi:hypothetical protein